jgi:hypothetical protein
MTSLPAGHLFQTTERTTEASPFRALLFVVIQNEKGAARRPSFVAIGIAPIT